MGHWLGEYIKLNYLAGFFLFVQLLNEMNNFLRLTKKFGSIQTFICTIEQQLTLIPVDCYYYDQKNTIAHGYICHKLFRFISYLELT